MGDHTAGKKTSSPAPPPQRVTHDPRVTPICFGVLETVFPMGADGLRASPEECLMCLRKTECLQKAMAGSGGVEVREEILDRAYSSGVVGFFERWSRKKDLHRRGRMEKMKKKS